MKKLTIPGGEFWDERTEKFIYTEPKTLVLEHSLVSIQKWESKWNKAFLTKEEKSLAEMLDYMKCMTITQNVDPKTYLCLTKNNIEEIVEYMNAPMTATKINDRTQRRPNHEIITAELIYYWMIMFGVPFECRKWHINQLIALIRVCEIKGQKQKKRNPNDVLQEYASINAARRKLHNTKG